MTTTTSQPGTAAAAAGAWRVVVGRARSGGGGGGRRRWASRHAPRDRRLGDHDEARSRVVVGQAGLQCQALTVGGIEVLQRVPGHHRVDLGDA